AAEAQPGVGRRQLARRRYSVARSSADKRLHRYRCENCEVRFRRTLHGSATAQPPHVESNGKRLTRDTIFDARARSTAPRSALLIGPYDPMGGEYTFLAPPLGVWRLCGVLRRAGHDAEIFDPNCCDGAPDDELRAL